MTLESVITAAQTTTKKWWKWILAGVIALIGVFLVWRLRAKANELAALRAEYAAMRDFVADLKARAEATRDVDEAQVLSGQVVALTAQMEKRGLELVKKRDSYISAQRQVDQAKTWDELDKLAKKDPPK